ncbi:MAG: hypothetical protein IPO81_13490 [Kouleothrix sp.]|nr:hypothetical protein [Kouleothrix sp.]
MIAIEQGTTNRIRMIWLSVALALLAAATYVLIGQRLLGVGDLKTDDGTATITYVAAGGYLLGGLLILPRWRWLWIIGAAINALVILAFYRIHAGEPSVLWSAGGVSSKAAQVLLELSLLYLIFTGGRRAGARPV